MKAFSSRPSFASCLPLWLLVSAALLPPSAWAKPKPPDPHVVSGTALFTSSGCVHCHGDGGQGGEIGPNLQDVGKRLQPAAITTQIHDGGKAMPAFGESLTDAQIADLVAYLRTLKPPPKPGKKH